MAKPLSFATFLLKNSARNVVAVGLSLTPSLLFTFAGSPANAADRLVQLLGRCGASDAQFIGNRRHGSIELTSFSPDGDAGVVIDGLEGRSISELQNIAMSFEPPQGTNVSTFILRVTVQNPGKPDKVQRFSIGPDFNPNLPNLPTRNDNDDGTKQLVSVSRTALLQEKSKLKGSDVITKVSFIFSATKKGGRAVQFVDEVLYGGLPVYPLLQPVTCNLK